MAKLHAYLNFNGNCEEAFDFYQKVFKKKSDAIIRFSDMPDNPEFQFPESDKNKIMHTSIQVKEGVYLMGSDCIESFGQKAVFGTSTYIMLDTDTAEEAHDLHNALIEDAQNVEMPLGEQDWAELFSSFQDKYGVAWMVHYEGNKKMY